MKRIVLILSILSVVAAQNDGYRRELQTGYLHARDGDHQQRNLQFYPPTSPSFEMPTSGNAGWGRFGEGFGGGFGGGGSFGTGSSWPQYGSGSILGGGGYTISGGSSDSQCLFVKCQDGWYCENGECVLEPQIAIGRPFVDKYGKPIEASSETQTIPSWSSNCPTNIVVFSAENHNHTEAVQSLGNEWTKRALGEHASIASFAAFTMELMSNQAPPKLIQDALVAAADEYRHAQTSFEIASLFLGESVEPEPIPPSSHEFGYNITALALATAEEGCIGETLSALAAANDVDHEIDAHEGISDSVKTLLKEKMRTIVIEESRHAMLAWNTVVWACTKEDKACEAVLNQMFTSENFSAALQRYFPKSAHLQLEGMAIFQKLVPFIREKVNQWDHCRDEKKTPKLDLDGMLAEQLADVIVQGVICTL